MALLSASKKPCENVLLVIRTQSTTKQTWKLQEQLKIVIIVTADGYACVKKQMDREMDGVFTNVSSDRTTRDVRVRSR